MSGDQNPGRSPSCFALRASQDFAVARGAKQAPSEALAEEGHLGVAQPAERPLREREDAGAKPAAQSRFLVAPLAQLVERSAYTRRELRTGARLEVRILQGVRKAPLNGRRLVPKTRVTARSGVRFLSLPPNRTTEDG
jgi:hypothetical protein